MTNWLQTWVTSYQLPPLFLSAPPQSDDDTSPPSPHTAKDLCDPNAPPPQGGRYLMERVWRGSPEGEVGG